MWKHTRRLVVFALVACAGCATTGVNARSAAEASGNGSARTVAMIAGGILAAAGPAVVVAGVALDKDPATPPVEAFVAGAGLTVAGVATVLVAATL